MITQAFQHVDYLWSDSDCPADPVDQMVYRSNLLGRDLRITNYAGGNTSCKVPGPDPVTGTERAQLWIKGSGGDLGTLHRGGLAALDVERVRALEARRNSSPENEDELATLLMECLVPPRAAAPSIDTPLHALIPHVHVDHVHPDAVIALATAKGGADFTREVYGAEVGWLDWRRPGYVLAIELRALLLERPKLSGVVLGGHGLIAWGEDAKTCYETTLRLIERAAAFLDEREWRSPGSFGEAVAALEDEARRQRARRVQPLLRGLGDGPRPRLVHFRDDLPVLQFADSRDAGRLVDAGTSCPDHFLRTKQRPLLLDIPPGSEPDDVSGSIEAAFDRYREAYTTYYAANAKPDSPPMRDPNPVVVLWPGVGMFTLASSKREARIAAEFYVNAINVMRGAEALSSYQGLSDAEAFGIEYWALEEAKLRRMPAAKPLSGRVSLITGAAGGIGSAIARRFAAEGAALVLADLDIDGVAALASELGEEAVSVAGDVTDETSVDGIFAAALDAFGGVDIVVNNAGTSIAKPISETTATEYERVHAVIDRGSFLVSRAFARIAAQQQIGGDLVYVLSKNAVFAGVDNVAYGSAKAAQLHQMRLLAVELAPLQVRVNGVSPDAVVQGSKLFAGEWGAQRAAAYGVEREQLGDFYAQRSLLKREILPEDIAAACFAIVGGDLAKTTGAVIPVDGGVPGAFLR